MWNLNVGIVSQQGKRKLVFARINFDKDENKWKDKKVKLIRASSIGQNGWTSNIYIYIYIYIYVCMC